MSASGQGARSSVKGVVDGRIKEQGRGVLAMVSGGRGGAAWAAQGMPAAGLSC